ncbi:MAG: YggU family protein [Nanoarchaeota archaeon]|nr:YggU family protein [Nanoarchaeota archaeon]
MELDNSWKKHIENTRLKILVKPNASKNRIIGWDDKRQALKIEIKAKPENNMANIEIIKFFSKTLKKNVEIVSGRTSKTKVLRFG